MKHLNPRQGITTRTERLHLLLSSAGGVKHLNPRQGITTVVTLLITNQRWVAGSVKHLNPRQGITTERDGGASGNA